MLNPGQRALGAELHLDLPLEGVENIQCSSREPKGVRDEAAVIVYISWRALDKTPEQLLPSASGVLVQRGHIWSRKPPTEFVSRIGPKDPSEHALAYE